MVSVTITCLHCGTTATITSTGFHGTPKFCSKQCRHDHTLSELQCVACGKSFYRNATRIRRHEKYCSIECYHQSRAKKTHSISCKSCGEIFTVKTSTPQRYSYCPQCRKLRNAPKCICERCGKPFRGDKRYDRLYCSEECRRPPVYHTCETCGKVERIQPSMTRANRRFCSVSCYRKSTGETSIEKTIRLQIEALNIPFAQEYKIGRYSIDFLLIGFNLVIEVDGTYWHRTPRQLASDNRKDANLAKLGYMVIRFSEQQIKEDVGRCVETIRMLCHL